MIIKGESFSKEELNARLLEIIARMRRSVASEDDKNFFVDVVEAVTRMHIGHLYPETLHNKVHGSLDDIAQETCIKVYVAARTIKTDPFAFVKRTAVNCTIEHSRRAKKGGTNDPAELENAVYEGEESIPEWNIRYVPINRVERISVFDPDEQDIILRNLDKIEGAAKQITLEFLFPTDIDSNSYTAIAEKCGCPQRELLKVAFIMAGEH